MVQIHQRAKALNIKRLAKTKTISILFLIKTHTAILKFLEYWIKKQNVSCNKNKRTKRKENK